MFYAESFAVWLSRISGPVFNHLWQATIFSALVGLAAIFLRRGPARARYLIWLAASAKFAVPSALLITLLSGVGIDLSAAFSSTAQTSPALQYLSPIVSPIVSSPIIIPPDYLPESLSQTMSNSVVISQRHESLSLFLSAVWLSGFLLLLVGWGKRRRQVSVAIKAGRVIGSGREWQSLTKVTSWLGIRRSVQLVISPTMKEPGVWRSIRPIVLLPERVSEQLSDEELESLMMHEMVHVLRWDNLVSNIQMVLCCVFWFNPIVWLIDRALLKEREQACDEVVLRFSGAGEIYASSIRKVYRFCLSSRVTGLSAAGGSDLRRRLERIMTKGTSDRLSLTDGLLVSTVILASVTLSIIAGAINNDPVVTGTNVALRKAATELVQNMIDKGEECIDPSNRKCVRRLTAPLKTEGQLAQVVVHVDSNADAPLQASTAPVTRFIAKALIATTSTNASVPIAEPTTLFESAHPADLKRFVGRYAVDPSVMENYVFDVSVEGGELWLKPSHVHRRRLVGQSAIEYLDSESSKTRIRFNLAETGSVESLTLSGWGPRIVVRKLVLPAPSLEGNTTFRIKGFPNACIVAVAGTFNNWNQSQYLFTRVDGEWVCRLNLPRGKYQYKFIIDGNWLVDTLNPVTERDDREFENSVLIKP